MKIWFLYPTICAPMDFQMALDEVLFGRAASLGGGMPSSNELPMLRFYYSSGSWVTLGYSLQRSCVNGGMRSSEEAIRVAGEKNMPVCRRITGGGYVLHGQDLLFSVIARKKDDEALKSVRTSYRKIHEAVREGFRRCGKRLKFYQLDAPWLRKDACFEFPVATDLLEGDRKVAGGAQKRSSGFLLHQESIRIHGKWEGERLLPKICEGFETIFGVQIQKVFPDPGILEEAEQLVGRNRVSAHEGS